MIESCKQVIAMWPDKVKLFHEGKTVMGFFVGQVMRATDGKFDSREIHDTIFRLLKEK